VIYDSPWVALNTRARAGEQHSGQSHPFTPGRGSLDGGVQRTRCFPEGRQWSHWTEKVFLSPARTGKASCSPGPLGGKPAMAWGSLEPAPAPAVGQAAVRSYHFKHLWMQAGTACSKLTLPSQKECSSLKITHTGRFPPAWAQGLWWCEGGTPAGCPPAPEAAVVWAVPTQGWSHRHSVAPWPALCLSALGCREARAFPPTGKTLLWLVKRAKLRAPLQEWSEGWVGGLSALDPVLLLDGVGLQLGAGSVVASPPQGFLGDGSQGAGTASRA